MRYSLIGDWGTFHDEDLGSPGICYGIFCFVGKSSTCKIGVACGGQRIGCDNSYIIIFVLYICNGGFGGVQQSSGVDIKCKITIRCVITTCCPYPSHAGELRPMFIFGATGVSQINVLLGVLPQEVDVMCGLSKMGWA
jgi:hypothetical protein